MDYTEIIEVAQHFQKKVGNDTLEMLSGLEKDLTELQLSVRQAKLPPLLKQALVGVTNDLKKYLENVNCDKIIFAGSLSCLPALHEIYQEDLILKTMGLVKEIKLVTDKLKISRGLQLVIEGCIQPVRKETKRLNAKKLNAKRLGAKLEV